MRRMIGRATMKGLGRGGGFFTKYSPVLCSAHASGPGGKGGRAGLRFLLPRPRYQSISASACQAKRWEVSMEDCMEIRPTGREGK